MASGATAYLLQVMPIEIFIQGLGNRFLFVIAENQTVPKEKPENYFLSYETEHSRWAEIRSLGNLLALYKNKAGKSCLFVSEEASKKLLDFDYETKLLSKKLYDECRFNFKSSYLVRLGEFAMKISALEAFNRSNLVDFASFSEPYLIEIGTQDVENAIDFVRQLYGQFERLLRLWESIQAERRVQYRKMGLQDVKSIIADKGGMISLTDLRRRSAISGEKLWKMIYDLNENGEIEVYQGKEDKSKTGAATKYIILKSAEVKIPDWLTKLSRDGFQ